MGRSKADLPFGPERMLQRVVRIMSGVVSPVAVVAARDQKLLDLSEGVLIVHDTDDWRGPLAGLAAGLGALRAESDAAYASSCDVPFLEAAFVRALISHLGEHDLVMVRDGRYHHPLTAVYRTRLASTIQELLDQDQSRPVALLDCCDAMVVDAEELRCVDPGLDSLRNLNTPDEYRAALREAGFGDPVGGGESGTQDEE